MSIKYDSVTVVFNKLVNPPFPIGLYVSTDEDKIVYKGDEGRYKSQSFRSCLIKTVNL